MTIPNVFHRLWIGPAAMPETHRKWIAECDALHPAWTSRLWTEGDLAPLVWPVLQPFWRRANPVHKSDIGGYLLVHRFGGVYADTDYRWIRPLDPYLYECSAFCCQTDGGIASASIFGAMAGHPAFARALELVPCRFQVDHQLSTTRILEEALRGRTDVRRFERRVFIPVAWRDREQLQQQEDFSGSCAVHQFAGSWVQTTPA